LKQWKAELSLFVVTLIWGGTFLFTKIGLDDCTPSSFLIIRFMIALGLTVVFYNKRLLNISSTTMKQGLILGLLFGGGFVLQTYGLKFTTVSKSAFITGMTVPITPFVFKLIQKSKINFWSKIGVVVATTGLYIFTNPDFDDINPGDFMTLLSTFFWAFYITLMDKYTKGSTESNKTGGLVAYQFVAALIPAILTLLIFELDNYRINFSMSLLSALAFNGILASFMVTIIHTSVQRYTTPVKAALIFSLEPIVASFLAMLIISEVLSFREFSGALLLFGGLLVSELGPIFQKKIKY